MSLIKRLYRLTYGKEPVEEKKATEKPAQAPD